MRKEAVGGFVAGTLVLAPQVRIDVRAKSGRRRERERASREVPSRSMVRREMTRWAAVRRSWLWRARDYQNPKRAYAATETQQSAPGAHLPPMAAVDQPSPMPAYFSTPPPPFRISTMMTTSSSARSVLWPTLEPMRPRTSQLGPPFALGQSALMALQEQTHPQSGHLSKWRV